MGAFFQELFRVNLYKRSQGRIARQLTFGALAIIVAMGAWSLYGYYDGFVQVTTEEGGTAAAGSGFFSRFVVPLVVLVAGLWASFRVVQMPNFADFLISVEAEMNKVAWPTRSELFRASVVVMVMIFILAAILFVYDAIWSVLVKDLLGLR